MLKLDTTTRKIQAVLSGAITTNQLPCMVSYSDDNGTTYVGGTQLTNTNSTTAVDICAAPGASTVRDIDYLSIRNGDTASATVTVMLDDNSTDYEIVKATLAVGDHLVYTHGDGWRVIDTDGNLKTGGSSGTGDVVGPASSTNNSLARFDGTTGKLLKDGAVIGADVQAYDANLSNVREVLTGNRTYYVRTDGSDSNTGLVDSAGGAFLTIQKAVDTAATLDFSTYAVTINVGNGTYTGATSLKTYYGVGPITINGDTTTPSNVVVSTTSANAFYETGGARGRYVLQGFKLQTTTSGTGIFAAGAGADISFNNIEFGACAAAHIGASDQGLISYTSDYTISGGSWRHFLATRGGIIATDGLAHTITLSGTPAFSIAFADSQLLSVMQINGQTYSGSATGVRYSVTLNAVIDTIGGGATYFPGNSAGSTATGGQYA